ncbi:hypothetical protein Acr_18g0011380 [Actinidia rufa]|uniref:Uncharacterized protein n=1 Tax=Actinidia rufa TaxID=165716 RepID=A0A7J0G8E1_9ERIC|nr:hypothetical protein Acr_18g0011380 [Actinidia rufa]
MDWNMQKKIKVGRQSRRDHVKGEDDFHAKSRRPRPSQSAWRGVWIVVFISSDLSIADLIVSVQIFSFRPLRSLSASLNNRIKQNTLISHKSGDVMEWESFQEWSLQRFYLHTGEVINLAYSRGGESCEVWELPDRIMPANWWCTKLTEGGPPLIYASCFCYRTVVLAPTCTSPFSARHTLFILDLQCRYTLFKSPGSNSGWLYFKARSSRNVIKGSPNNVKGWKKRFFFVSGDDWEFFPSIASGERAPQANVANKLPILTDTEEERTKKVLDKIGPGGYFNVPAVLDSRTFRRFVAPSRAEMSSSGGDNDASGDGAVAASGDEGGKVQDPLGLGPFSLSSSSDSGSYLATMSKRISLTKLPKKVEESKAATSSSKGVVIKEKWPRDEVPDSSPNKKVKNNESKAKETIPPPEAKKLKPNKAMSRETVRPAAPGEGPLKKPGEVLGSGASVMANAAVAEKILTGVILPADKERVDKLSLDQVVTKFLHILGQCLGLPSLSEAGTLGTTLPSMSPELIQPKRKWSELKIGP